MIRQKERENISMRMEIHMKVLKSYFLVNFFQGQFASNKANGYGRFGAKDGTKYEGQWKDNIQDGYGIEIWPDGSRYEGYYKNGKKEGQGIRINIEIQYALGTYVWANGTSYIGNWVANKCFGQVSLQFLALIVIGDITKS